MASNDQQVLQKLAAAFARHKAEWLGDQVFQTFTEPTYFPELALSRPCILVGGRGTGKTTVLRAMSYEGQFARDQRQPASIRGWTQFGLYYRVNTNRVAAFKGDELSTEKWTKLFAHYFNLLICEKLAGFLNWYEALLPTELEIGSEVWEKCSASLGLSASHDLLSFTESLANGISNFESSINNIVDGPLPFCSLQGAPMDIFFDGICKCEPFKGKSFLILLDEYENFSDEQQQVVNTIIKHCGPSYIFKVGVREMGWRCRNTLNSNERLVSPSDYVRIDIADELKDEKFAAFAESICKALISSVPDATLSISEMLPSISLEEEAALLDDKAGLLKKVVSSMAKVEDSGLVAVAASLTPLQSFLLQSWPENKNRSLEEILSDYDRDRATWATRFSNYTYSILFALRRGKTGIRKYYSGWDTFLKLSAGNIRYCLELLEQAMKIQLSDIGKYLPLSPSIQTRAAQAVGRKNLSELEGLSVKGALLTKLLLGMGRVFQLMAADPIGHAPEINQFHLPHSSKDTDPLTTIEECDALLKAAVMHLALLRFSGSKLGDAGETRDYDYTIHPIFSAFFVYSYRLKRKMLVSSSELLSLTVSPKKTIEALLEKSGRLIDEEADEAPDQLMLFKDFYDRS
jgi:hypothetical protein